MSCCQSRLLRAKRETSRRDRTDLAQADLGHHSIKAGARDAACRRAPEIVIDRFDARPAQGHQTIAHRILQGAALAIVENLMGGGLPYIQDRLALRMVRRPARDGLGVDVQPRIVWI